MQCVSTGTYFGRIKIEGKVFRESLGADVVNNAKQLLSDFFKKKRKQTATPALGTFGEARFAYELDLPADHSLKEASKPYRFGCIRTSENLTGT